MRSQGSGPSPLARLLAIAAVVTLMGSALALLVRTSGESHPPDADTGAGLPGPIIPAEQQMLHRGGEELAAYPDAAPRPEAQPRTLAIYRRLRAFPGAPPRIPHALTDEEFRLNRCASCHERGGFVARFGGYAPVTPHPDLMDCLQCHTPDAMSVGVPLPDRAGGLPCGQCHVDPDRPPPSLVSLDWAPLAWPPLQGQSPEGAPPPLIPHDLEFRGNCQACHTGPGAVREIRTDHPERISCRQCHVPALDEGVFSRPIDSSTATSGAVR